MGLPERLTERQLRRLKGPREGNVRRVKRGNGMLLLAAAFNGVAVLIGLLGKNGGLETLWVALGIFWLLFTYLLVRQRLHLRRLAGDGR